MNANPSQILQLETLSPEGVPPTSRIPSAFDADQIANSLIYAGSERSRTNAKLRGMFDGNPPYSPGKLKSEAQAWRANINFMEADATTAAALVPFYDLFSGAKYRAQVETEEEGEPGDQRRWSDIITEEFDWLLKSYDGFDFNMQQMLPDMVRYGKGFLIWRDPIDFRFRCIPSHRCYVPDGTDCYAGNLEILVIREQLKVHEVWAYIKDKELARQSGWNTQGCIDAIINAMPELNTDSVMQYDYEFVQQRIKDHDLYEGMRSSTVSIRHVLVKEFSGKVSHYITEEYNGTRMQTAREKVKNYEKQFLYESSEKFDDFKQFIATFFLETVDGSWNGAQGIGHKIYSLMALKDRVKCAAIDLTFLRTGVNLQAKNANAAQKAQLIRFGPVNIIPADFEVQQATILGDIQSPVAMDKMLDNVVEKNTGVFRQVQQRESGNPETAKAVELRFQNSTVLSNSAVNRFYGNLDKFYAEIYRRASNPNLPDIKDNEGIRLAREFQKRCKDRQVPAKALKNINYVRAYQSAGNGSAWMRQQNISSTMPFYQLLPEDGRQNFLDYALSSINGQTMADLFNPKSAKEKLPSDDMAFALLENSAIKEGAPVSWTPSQNNTIHAQTHLQAAAQAAASIQQGADPSLVASFIDGIGKHAIIHIQKLQQDSTRKEEYKALMTQWTQLAKFHDQLMGQIQQINQQKAQQQQQQMQAQMIAAGRDEGSQVEMAKVQSDAQIKALKTQHQMQLKDMTTRHNMALKSATATQDLALKDATTASNIHRENVKTQSELAQPEVE